MNLLKWVGGKREHADVYVGLLFDGTETAETVYVEPFFGSGAVFFAAVAAGRIDGSINLARLSDHNGPLIRFWRDVRDFSDVVARELASLPRTKEAAIANYDGIRRDFNDALTSAPAVRDSALLLWLNRTGFNGLYRLNRRGEYNVACGVRMGARDDTNTPLTLPSVEDIRHAASALAGASIACQSWDRAFRGTEHPSYLGGQRLFLDPPYDPLDDQDTSHTAYTASRWTHLDTRDLVFRTADRVVSKANVRAVICNHDSTSLRELFAAARATRPGLVIDVHELQVQRRVGQSAASRKPVAEIAAVFSRSSSIHHKELP